MPMVTWLRTTSMQAQKRAMQAVAQADSYSLALATTPPLVEIEQNHVTHAVLEGTNFFGINTIPIALNEADYLRMWVQAATVMTTYQAVAEQSLAAVPSAQPAPATTTIDSSGVQTVTTLAATAAADDDQPTGVSWLIQELERLLASMSDFLQTLGPFGQVLSQAVNAILNFVTSQFFNILSHAILDPIIYTVPFVPLFTPALLPALGLMGLIGLAGIQPAPAPEAAAVPGAPAIERQLPAAATSVVTAGAPPGAGAPAAHPAPAPDASALSTANAAPQPATPYLVGGPDGEGFSPTTGATAAASDDLAASQAAAAVLAAGVQAKAVAVARARRRARKYRYEDLEGDGRMTLDNTVDDATEPPPVAVSAFARGAGPLLAESTPADGARGLTRVTGGVFDDGARVPLLPQAWDGSGGAGDSSPVREGP
jgi:PPE-repeat protein